MVEPEPVKVDAELKTAQAAVDKMQCIIESALICLLEPRQGYRLSQIGILEAFQHTALRYWLELPPWPQSLFLKLYEVPTLSHDRLLGRCQFIRCNKKGMIYWFSDSSKLSSQAQNDKLKVYNLGIKKIVAHFLAHFSGNETFHLRPQVVIKLGAPTTALQASMGSIGHELKGYSGTGWRTVKTMERLSDQEFHDVAEMALSDFKKLKEPVEVKSAVLKSVGIHIKDMLGATAHLEGADLSIKYPCEQDLENWVGWNPALMDTLREIELSQREDANDSRIGLEKMEVMLTAILKNLEEAEALRAEKEGNLLKGFKDYKAKTAAEK